MPEHMELERGSRSSRDIESVVSTQEPAYKRVKGWLLLYCMAQVIIGPIAAVYFTIVRWHAHLRFVNKIPGLLLFDVLHTILLLGITGFGFYAGEHLWSVRPGAVRVVKKYLLAGAGSLWLGVILPYAAGLPSRVADSFCEQVLPKAAFGLLPIALWYAYFSRSRRVKATYGP